MPKGRQKTFRDVFAKLLSRPVDDAVAAEIGEIFRGVSTDMSNDEAIAMALIYKALKGDTAAAKYISEMVGEKQTAPVSAKLTVRLVK